jgi:hypothetical protein
MTGRTLAAPHAHSQPPTPPSLFGAAKSRPLSRPSRHWRIGRSLPTRPICSTSERSFRSAFVKAVIFIPVPSLGTLQHERQRVRVASLCFLVLAIPSLIVLVEGYGGVEREAAAFTTALTAGSFGLPFGALSAGLLGDRLGRKRTVGA